MDEYTMSFTDEFSYGYFKTQKLIYCELSVKNVYAVSCANYSSCQFFPKENHTKIDLRNNTVHKPNPTFLRKEKRTYNWISKDPIYL